MQATQVPAAQPRRTELPAATSPATGDEAIVRRHVDGVWRFLRSLGAPRDVAEDLTQEAFAAAWRKGKQHLPPSALGAFLRRAARFLWLEHRRDARRSEAALSALALQAWEHERLDDGEDLADAMRGCVRLLRGRAAEAVQLAYGRGASRDEIARVLRMQNNGVKTLLARTRAWLERCIRRQMS